MDTGKEKSSLKRSNNSRPNIFLHSFIFLVILSLQFFPFVFDVAAEDIPKIRHSVKPLDLSRAPSKEEIMAAGQLGGQLYTTYEVEDNERGMLLNFSFGQAIQEWNKHNYKQAVNLFWKHVEDYPDSPWVSEALLHIGCDANYHGRYTEAEEQFRWIIDNNKDSTFEGAQRLVSKAMLRLGVLKVAQNNLDAAGQTFTELKKQSLDWRDRTYASHWLQRLSRYKSRKLAMLNCGTDALAYLMEKEGKKVEANEVAAIIPNSDKGQSISELIYIASGYGYGLIGLHLSPSDLYRIPLPTLIQIEGKQEGDRGHYWVLEKILNDNLTLYDPQSGQTFTQTVDEFSKEWTGRALVSDSKIGEEIPGKKLTENEEKESYGGCCGAPRPEEDLGDDDDDQNCDCPPCSKGAPTWNVNKINMNLFVKDIPLWYTPPIGPPVEIQISYNSQSAIAYHEPFGNKWSFNYGSYLVVDTAGNVTIFMPDGRRDVFLYNGQGGYTKPFGVFNTLVKIAENHYELKFLDGTVYVYSIPSGTNSQQPFLVEIRDAYGQHLTFGYNSNVQLTTIIDALDRDTTLTYYPSGLVEYVHDPFGRSAHFEYDPDQNLTMVTDMGGYWSRFTYDADVYIASIENERGRWDFFVEPSDTSGANSDDYPPPGDLMWQNYRVTITNPLGGKEEYFFYGGSGNESWFVSPRDYIEWQSRTVNNFQNNVPKTYYSLTEINQKGKVAWLEYPEGGYKMFQYDSVTGKLKKISDHHDNSYIWHDRNYTYNSNGFETSFIDARGKTFDARGKTTITTYYPNNIDIQTIESGLGTISFTYDGDTHKVRTVTDRLGNVTQFDYNSYGQLRMVTEAMGTSVEMVTELVYDPSHNLTEVKRDGSVLMTFAYDDIGRVETQTDASGLTLTHEYNNLDQVTKILYPDTIYNGSTPVDKFMELSYASCCPRMIESITDRAGLTTSYTYDALKRLIWKQGTDGIFGYEYDANGNLKKLTDPDQKETLFDYNLDNRLIKKTYADTKFVQYDYDKAGLLTKFTNSRNIEKNLTYDPNHNLLTIDYSDSTPDVVFTYDDYNRVDTRTDGMGVYNYDYDANNRLRFIDGPWANDIVEFQYNELGHLKSLIPQGGQTVTYYYDYDPENPGENDIGRLVDIQSGANTYTYGYTGVNSLIQSLTRPNGSFTEYIYNDPLKRLTDVINKNSSNQVINSYNYTYNNLDIIDIETIINGNPITSFTEGVTTYANNNVNQLENTTNPSRTYTYDDDGNMTQGYTPEGYTILMTYDAENRLTSAQYTDNGSVIHRTEYSYSGDDLLAEIKKLSNGTPVSDTRYVMAGFLPVQERDGSNNVVRQYTWGLNYGGGIGGLLNLRQNSNDYSYLYDGKGNITTLIDGSQNVVATYAYDPFGTLMHKTGSLNQPYMFSTKEYDEETGLSYYGYRFYSPTIGRWTTRDPIGEEGGINLYGFVGNDPVHYVDPKGKGPILFGVCFATTVADAIDRGHEISEALDKRAELRKEKEKRVRQCEDPTLPADRQQLIRDRIDAIDKEILKLGHETAVSGLWGVGKLFGLTFLCGLALTP